MSFRSFLYKLASVLGDINAAKHGPKALVKRIVRKKATVASTQLLNKLFK